MCSATINRTPPTSVGVTPIPLRGCDDKPPPQLGNTLVPPLVKGRIVTLKIIRENSPFPLYTVPAIAEDTSVPLWNVAC